ncbi:hypothetical protein MUP01_00715 [Candidatus Bathyarchaeota archaeon]|nr:hypothetical protein [Candidatus Bathyarchaeota archaeon]
MRRGRRRLAYGVLVDKVDGFVGSDSFPSTALWGLARSWLEETIPLAGTDYVETSAFMAKHNPVRGEGWHAESGLTGSG